MQINFTPSTEEDMKQNNMTRTNIGMISIYKMILFCKLPRIQKYAPNTIQVMNIHRGGNEIRPNIQSIKSEQQRQPRLHF